MIAVTSIASVGAIPGCGFTQPGVLLLVLPWVVLCVLLWHRRPEATLLVSSASWLGEVPPTWRTRLRAAPEACRCAAGCALIVALAGPASEIDQDLRRDAIDIVFALDLSGSMVAVDMSQEEILAYQQIHGTEPPNRMVLARDTLRDVVAERRGDRLGLVVFARSAFVQFPLTLDTATMLHMIDQLDLGVIDPAGTAIGNAIALSVRTLLDASSASRTIILITDGKATGGNIAPLEAARIAADEGIRVDTILIGRDGPTLVPAGRSLRDGRSVYQLQHFPIDPALLEVISGMTGGRSYHVERADELARDLHRVLDDLERTRVEDQGTRRTTPHPGPWPLLTLLMLLLEAWLRQGPLRRYPA